MIATVPVLTIGLSEKSRLIPDFGGMVSCSVIAEKPGLLELGKLLPLPEVSDKDRSILDRMKDILS